LGRAIALRLAERGCNIAIADIDSKKAEKTADEIRSKGVKANCYRVDISKLTDITKLRDDVTNEMGPVDILVK